MFGVIEKNKILPIVLKASKLFKTKSSYLADNLKSFLLEIKNAKLILRATNLEILYSGEIDVAEGKDGVALVNAKQFANIIKIIPTKTFSIKTTPKRMVLQSGNLEYKLKLNSLEDLPVFEFEKIDEYKININGKQFSDLLGKIIPAMSNDEHETKLYGAQITFLESPEKVLFLSCDRYRIHLLKRGEVPLTGEHNTIFVPYKSVVFLHDLLAKIDNNIDIFYNKHFLKVNIGEESAVFRLQDNILPDISMSLDIQYHLAKVNRLDFLNLIKRLSIFSDSEVPALKIKLKKDMLFAELTFSETTYGKEKMEIEYQDDEEFFIINGKYMLDALNTMKSENVILGYHEENGAVILIEPETGYQFLAIIMTISLDS